MSDFKVGDLVADDGGHPAIITALETKEIPWIVISYDDVAVGSGTGWARPDELTLIERPL